MTAEIAILNKKAIALAADSAATSDKEEFYSHNKLFSLSKNHPVGIMIYQNSGFMGYPWETIINCFRDTIGDTYCSNLEGYLKKFLVFLEKEKITLQPGTDKHALQHEYSSQIISKMLHQINDYFMHQLRWVTDKTTTQKKIDEIIKTTKSNLLAQPRAERLNSKDESSIKSGYTSVIIDLIETTFPGNVFSSDQINELVEIVILGLIRRFGHFFYTGIVVAGFGKREQFPSCFSVHVNQLLNNKLIYFKGSDVRISNVLDAEIVPFADTNAAMNILKGGESPVEAAGFQQADAFSKNLKEYITAKGALHSDDRTKVILEAGEIFQDQISKLQSHLEKIKFDLISKPLLHGLSNCNITEMALIAEILVNMKNFRQIIPYDQQETVGGPIDVAVISKEAGLVWVKRKHYFDKELNNHYFNNYFDNYTGRNLAQSQFLKANMLN